LATNEQYAFVRAHLDDRIAVVFNRARDDAKIEINVGPELADGDYTEALSGNKITVANGKLEFDLPGQTAAFISRTR
jgi:hypothetical protein